MDSICFVTGNKHKLKAAQDILKRKLNNKDVDVDEIQTVDVEEVVKEKAKLSYDIIKKTVMVEDTGFYLDAWNGFPGALIKWSLKKMGYKDLCKAMEPFKNRNVILKACICLYNGKDFKIFTGEVKGTIPMKPRGVSKFGEQSFDSIFVPDGYDKTFAEMTLEEKNPLSHRKFALEKMKSFLDENPDF
jgi:XTP/dITP diphosphohydrolase